MDRAESSRGDMSRPSVSLDADRVTLHLVSLAGVPFSSALTEEQAAKLAVDIAQLLAFPWRNMSATAQFCPRHSEQLIVCGAYCDMCATDVLGARYTDDARTTS